MSHVSPARFLRPSHAKCALYVTHCFLALLTSAGDVGSQDKRLHQVEDGTQGFADLQCCLDVTRCLVEALNLCQESRAECERIG